MFTGSAWALGRFVIVPLARLAGAGAVWAGRGLVGALRGAGGGLRGVGRWAGMALGFRRRNELKKLLVMSA